MKLPREDFKRLQTALEAALPQDGDLDTVTRRALGLNFTQIGARDSLPSMIRLVIERAESNNQLRKLIDEAQQYTSGNPMLTPVARRLLHKLECVDALLQFPQVDDPETLGVLSGLIPEKTVEEAADEGARIFGIVNSCLTYSPYILKVVAALRQYGGDSSSQVQRLYKAFDVLVPAPIPRRHLCDLLSLARGTGITKEHIKTLYYGSGGRAEFRPAGDSSEDVLLYALTTLANMGRLSTGMAPVGTFAVRLAVKYPEVSAALHEWGSDVGRHLGAATDLDSHLPTRRDGPATPLYLLIELAPQTADTDKYEVQAWISHDGLVRMLYADDEPKLTCDIPELIPKLLDLIADDLVAANNHLIIEFFLPVDLLYCEVEDWVVDGEPIGMKHPVVIRSHERARRKRFWPAWSGHWDDDLLTATSEVAVEWAREADERYWRDLRLRLGEPQVMCLAVTLPRRAGAVLEQRVLPTILNAGTPIAIWSRDPAGDAERLQSEIESLLGDNPLSVLPATLHKCREALWRVGEPRHLTLLWDDFKRRLPVPHLETPQI